MQSATDLRLFHDRVVTCCNGVITQRAGTIQNRFELNLLVTTQTRVGSSALRVLFNEIFDDAGVELFGHIPDIKRNTDHVSGATSIVRIFDGAATASARTILLRIG